MSNVQKKHRVTVIPGDGIGPECIASAQRIIGAAGAPTEWDEQHAGEPLVWRCFDQPCTEPVVNYLWIGCSDPGLSNLYLIT